jgi:hypothetical protein
MEKMEEIKAIRVEIKEIYEKLTNKKGEIYQNYIEYVDKNKKNNFFGLDSLHFQNKLIEIQYETITKQYQFVDNRMYCDYYKLFGLITQFLKKNYNDNFDNLLKNKHYPVYKDLEQYKVYDFNIVNDIHRDIIVLIKHLYEKVNSVKNEIDNDKQKMFGGLNIANYVYNFIFSNTVTETNVKLFEEYLDSYHSHHITVLQHLKETFLLMLNQLDPPGPPNGDEYVNDFEVVPNTNIISVPEPVVEFLKEPIPEPVVEFLKEPIPEPVVEFLKEPIPEPVVEFLKEPIPEPVEEPVVDSVPESVKEVIGPVPEPVEEPILEPFPEPVEEPILEPFPEPIVEPVDEPFPEPVVEPVVEPVPEQVIEPVVEEVIEPVVEEVIEPVVEEVIESVVEEVIEPVVEEVIEPVVEPVPEQGEVTLDEISENIQEYPLQHFKIINVIDYIKDSTPDEVKNHIINTYETDISISPSTISPVQNKTEPIQNAKEKKKKRR